MTIRIGSGILGSGSVNHASCSSVYSVGSMVRLVRAGFPHRYWTIHSVEFGAAVEFEFEFELESEWCGIFNTFTTAYPESDVFTHIYDASSPLIVVDAGSDNVCCMDLNVCLCVCVCVCVCVIGMFAIYNLTKINFCFILF